MSDDDFTAAILYRMACGLSADLAEIRRFDRGWGRAFASRVWGDCQTIEIHVARSRRGDPAGEVDPPVDGGSVEVAA